MKADPFNALSYARRVLKDELAVRLESFCVKRADGSFDESVMDARERRDIRECRLALKKIDLALAARTKRVRPNAAEA
jgi:hypothetical protein